MDKKDDYVSLFDLELRTPDPDSEEGKTSKYIVALRIGNTVILIGADDTVLKDLANELHNCTRTLQEEVEKCSKLPTKS